MWSEQWKRLKNAAAKLFSIFYLVPLAFISISLLTCAFVPFIIFHGFLMYVILWITFIPCILYDFFKTFMQLIGYESSFNCWISITCNFLLNKNVMNVGSGFECGACSLEFSATEPERTPRILKECGHTLCQKCVCSIFNKQNQKKSKKRYITCPFCKQPSKFKGSISTLPKNYSLIEVLDEKNKNLRDCLLNEL